ncbi:hypothetical protein [Paenibacillus wenxiniae]|uniref:Uncharacterized protein n=1 Tax=Paenibacillus wenxiniae TaxID=1636843 RepID=A0ABW4RH93_9BACL
MNTLCYTMLEDGIGMTEPYFIMLYWCELAGKHRSTEYVTTPGR